MKTALPFQVGDRVRTVKPLVSLPLGSSGTIYRAVRAGNLYGVLFDSEAILRVMHHGYLESSAGHQQRTVGEPDD
jgi:hypothetical protein